MGVSNRNPFGGRSYERQHERQFREADATVDQALATFISKIKSISGKWDDVAPVYIVERALLELCDELTKLIDDPGMRTLRNRIAEYSAERRITTNQQDRAR